MTTTDEPIEIDTSEITETVLEVQPGKPESLIDANGRPTSAGWRKINDLLRQPFAKVKSREGRGGKSFSYITARQVFDRLDAVVKPGNWETAWEPISVEWPQIAKVGICVFGVWRWDVGYANNSDEIEPTKQRRNSNSTEGGTWYKVEPEGMKAAVSDGIKRAAVHHGIGRYLYND